MQTYYRLHPADAPEFGAQNAWSALWGSVRSDDGTQTRCHECDGDNTGEIDPCSTCGGTGWEDAVRGYSCCHTAEDLVDYFTAHGVVSDTDEVIEFEGQMVGNGFDGEPLVVPTQVVRRMTWADIKA